MESSSFPPKLCTCATTYIRPDIMNPHPHHRTTQRTRILSADYSTSRIQHNLTWTTTYHCFDMTRTMSFPITFGFDLSSFDSDGSLSIASTPSENGIFSDVPRSSSAFETDVESITLVDSEDEDDLTVYSEWDSDETFYLGEIVYQDHNSEAVYFNATSALEAEDLYIRDLYLSDLDQLLLPLADQLEILDSIIRADSFAPPMPRYRIPSTYPDLSNDVALEAGVDEYRHNDDRHPWRSRRFERMHRSLYRRPSVRNERNLDIETHRFGPTQHPRVDGPSPQLSDCDDIEDGYLTDAESNADDEDYSPRGLQEVEYVGGRPTPTVIMTSAITEEERTALALGVDHISRFMRPGMLTENRDIRGFPVQEPQTAAAPNAELASSLVAPYQTSLGRSTSFESIDLDKDEHFEDQDYVVVFPDSPASESHTQSSIVL
ncbi:hypothetical protein C8Q80DRAFT_1353092 [Daedaleopsis nitida]|nr:hypothetical protein C8Q80DRAFT_1353092 [Daedaleopsis nitida]